MMSDLQEKIVNFMYFFFDIEQINFIYSILTYLFVAILIFLDSEKLKQLKQFHYILLSL